ncbi:juvenile hormone esterase-like [Pectinophora gossypiella]|uniref:juvenile hormone esterase-like n=1 Tax=Pectinophora gossypiella TaxID=13191 RepID=UPI00214E4AEA|nr:juvenile hormone esterase-like [Pectinophora gossypiella]
MWLGRLLCVVAVCAYAQAFLEDSRVVRTAQGSVRGYRAPEGDLFVFYGIPYATAPTGKDRFKAPLPGPIWMTTLDAVDKGIICPQADPWKMMAGLNKTMQEDCLLANVYVPDTEETNLPVVVMVHGGAYQIGFGDMGTPKNIVRSKKVIVVNFNYRLGAHGFLCLGTPDVPGNAGMKDQVAALRWVNKNIAKFGGNPNEVTISGYSAGSSAVDLLMLSKTTKGLYHRVIPESGANVAMWSVQVDPVDNAVMFAKSLIFDNVSDIYALEEFYKTLSYEKLMSDAHLVRKDNDFLFSPCVERNTGVEMFLDDNPVNILKKGKYNKVPMLYGFANMEGLFRVQFGFDQFVVGMNEKFSDFLPRDLQFESEAEKEKVAKEIKEFYFGDKNIGPETILGYIDLFTDVMFAYPTLRAVQLHLEAGHDKIYLYEFAFAPEVLPMPKGVTVKVDGANHCAQTSTVLDGGGMIMHNKDESQLSEDVLKMKALTRELWLNFMTTGNPTPPGSKLPSWSPVGAGRSPHMLLDLSPRMRGELLPERARFWDDIYSRYYRAPAPPPTPPPRHSEL